MFPLSGGGAYRAVEATDLAAGANEFGAIVGPTGCGKTTLLHVAAGLLRPHCGAMRVLVGGSLDIVAGAYEHTPRMQAKGQDIAAVIEPGRYLVSPWRCARIARTGSNRLPMTLLRRWRIGGGGDREGRDRCHRQCRSGHCQA